MLFPSISSLQSQRRSYVFPLTAMISKNCIILGTPDSLFRRCGQSHLPRDARQGSTAPVTPQSRVKPDAQVFSHARASTGLDWHLPSSSQNGPVQPQRENPHLIVKSKGIYFVDSFPGLLNHRVLIPKSKV